MNKRTQLLTLRTESAAFYSFAVCALFFFLGGFFGLLAALSAAPDLSAVRNLGGIFSFSADGGVYAGSLWQIFFSLSLFPLVSFFLGFSALGIFGVPLCSAVRGFSLLYTFSTALRVFAADGILFALLVFVLPALVTVPCFFLVSVLALRSSCRFAAFALGRDRRNAVMCFSPEHLVPALTVFVTVFLLALIERYFIVKLAELAVRSANLF